MKLLPTSLAPIADATDTGGTRWATPAVQLETGPDGWTAVATDTKQLIKVTGEYVGASDEYPEWPALASAPNGQSKALVPAETWKKAFAAAAKLNKRTTKPILRSVAVKLADNLATFGSSDTEKTNLEQTKLVEGKFPPYEDILKRNPSDVVARLAVGGRMLADLLRSITSIAPDEQYPTAVELEIFSDGKPLRLYRQGQTAKVDALLMPLGGWKGEEHPAGWSGMTIVRRILRAHGRCVIGYPAAIKVAVRVLHDQPKAVGLVLKVLAKIGLAPQKVVDDQDTAERIEADRAELQEEKATFADKVEKAKEAARAEVEKFKDANEELQASVRLAKQTCISAGGSKNWAELMDGIARKGAEIAHQKLLTGAAEQASLAEFVDILQDALEDRVSTIDQVVEDLDNRESQKVESEAERWKDAADDRLDTINRLRDELNAANASNQRLREELQTAHHAGGDRPSTAATYTPTAAPASDDLTAKRKAAGAKAAETRRLKKLAEANLAAAV